MLNRRRFFEILSSLPVVGGLMAGETKGAARGGQRDYFKELGVRRFINAAGTFTSLTASLMPREVIEAMDYASEYFVTLDELQEKVGERIARLVDAEAAMVTAGAASALTLGTAAVLTGTDPEKIRRLPDVTGMKSEAIIQKSHRFPYDHAVRNCGVRMVEVETREELQAAVNDQTAMLLFLNAADNEGRIKAPEFAELGKQYGIATFNDCAADVPPVENLWKYNRMGFDLVTFSGGKGIRGPQSAGLLFGRRHLIEAARLNTSPNADSIGRGSKVNKEEILGMLVALELYLGKDHEREWREWENRAETIARSARAVPGVSSEIYVPEIANHVPHVKVTWDAERIPLTPEQVAGALRDGDPSIEVRHSTDALQVGVWMLRSGEEKIVARRLTGALQS